MHQNVNRGYAWPVGKFSFALFASYISYDFPTMSMYIICGVQCGGGVRGFVVVGVFLEGGVDLLCKIYAFMAA